MQKKKRVHLCTRSKLPKRVYTMTSIILSRKGIAVKEKFGEQLCLLLLPYAHEVVQWAYHKTNKQLFYTMPQYGMQYSIASKVYILPLWIA
jgi:hypothetical protein